MRQRAGLTGAGWPRGAAQRGFRGGVGAGSLLPNVPAAGEAQAAAVRGTGLRPGLTSAEPQQPSLARSSLERFLNEPRLFTRHSAAQLFEARPAEAHRGADGS